MATILSTDGGSSFELTPVHATRGRGDASSADGVVCNVRFEAYGEPVHGEAQLTQGGLARMISKLKTFAEKRQGMMQLRSDTNEIEFSLASKQSRWTQKINVTGLASVPKDGADDGADEGTGEGDGPAANEPRASFGVTYRQNTDTGGVVEHRCGMHSSFQALASFANDLEAELKAAPIRRGTGKVEKPGA